MKHWVAMAVALPIASVAFAAQGQPGAEDFLACQKAAENQNWNGVISSCEKAISANDEIFASHYLLGWAYLQNKDWAKCASNYDQFMTKLGSQDAPNEKAIATRQSGICHAQAGAYAKAIPKLEQAAAAKPNDFPVQTLLAHAYLRTNREDQALDAYNKVIQLKPDTANAYYYTGNILLRQRRSAEAEPKLTKYLELEPSGPFAPDAHFMVGQIQYQKSGGQAGAAEYASVKDHFGKFLAEKPDAPQAPDALYILGSIAAQEEDNEAAKTHFERFLQLRPSGDQAEEAKRFLEELNAAATPSQN